MKLNADDRAIIYKLVEQKLPKDTELPKLKELIRVEHIKALPPLLRDNYEEVKSYIQHTSERYDFGLQSYFQEHVDRIPSHVKLTKPQSDLIRKEIKQYRAFVRKRKDAMTAVTAALKSCTTHKQLEERYPELYKLLPKTPGRIVNAMLLRPVEKLTEAGVTL